MPYLSDARRQVAGRLEMDRRLDAGGFDPQTSCSLDG